MLNRAAFLVSCIPLRNAALDEQWYHAQARNQCLHLFVRWAWRIHRETAGCIEHFGEDVNVTDRVQENAWLLEHPVYRCIYILLIVQWLIPGVARVLAAHPGFVSNGLDGLHSDIALLASREQRLEVFGVVGVLHREVVVRKQHRIKVEAFEAAPVHSGNLQTMTGDADGPYQPLFLSFNG